MLRWTLGILALLIGLITTEPAGAQQRTVSIGFLLDGSWERNDAYVALFQKEILDLSRDEFDIRFPPTGRVVADWTVEGVTQGLDRLLADPDVDLVIASGVLASHIASRLHALPKPVVAPFVLNPELQGIPFSSGASGVPNLVYVTFPSDPGHDIRAFQRVVPFTRLVYLHTANIVDAIPELSQNTLATVERMGLEAEFVAVDGGNVTASLSAIPDGTEAVIVYPLLGLTRAQNDAVIEALAARKLPSYSVVGTSEVRRGMLAGTSQDFNIPKLARRVAVNTERILLGEDPATFQVVFQRDDRLTINMATARRIGLYPSWGVLTEAELIEPIRKEPTARVVSLASTVREALAENRRLAAQGYATREGAQDVASARSAILPEFELQATGAVIDSDLGSPIQAERTLTGAATARQVIWSERAWTNSAIQSHLQAGRVREEATVRLDVIHSASTAYLNVLRAKTYERIQRENLRVSRSNLELAQVRNQIGSSGPGEVYRWESRIASDQRAVIDANAQRNLAEMALNRILHRPIEESFTTTDIGLNDPVLLSSRVRLNRFLNNPWSFRVLREFLVLEALADAPELKRLDEAIAAQERAVGSAKAAFFSPTIAAQAQVQNVFSRSGAGSLGPQQGGDVTWNFGVNASIPLFDGGSRFAEVRRSRFGLDRLRAEREVLGDQIEQRIRTALHRVGASYAGIDLSHDAARAARQNFELVADAYARGVVSTLELLDAQNAALVADQGAANAVYDFLADFVDVERASGRFTFLRPQSEVEDMFQRLDTFFEQQRSTAE